MGRKIEGEGVRIDMTVSDQSAVSVGRGRSGAGAGSNMRGALLDGRPARDHGQQRTRHQQRQRDVNDEEQHDRRHAEEMNEARGLEAAEQRGQFGELHRLPDHQAGKHLNDADQDDADIEHALHGVVAGEIVVLQVKSQRIADIGDQRARIDRQQHAPETSGRQSIADVEQAVDRENPHAEEMPLQRALRLAADGHPIGKMQPPEQHLVFIDLPPAADHDEHGERVGPMHDAQRQGMETARMRMRSVDLDTPVRHPDIVRAGRCDSHRAPHNPACAVRPDLCLDDIGPGA